MLTFLWLLLLQQFLLVLADQVLRLSVLVDPGLILMAPVTLDAAFEVIVLALAADPATVGEVKVLLHHRGLKSSVCRVTLAV